MKFNLLSIFFLAIGLNIHAQTTVNGMEPIVLEQVIVGDDTLPAVTLEPVEIVFEKTPELDYKMRYHTNKAYPYSIRVARIVNEIEEELGKLETKRQRKKYLNSTEKLLKQEFKSDLKELTRTQGRVLILLVHRETGQTVHELISKYRSDFKAGWWEFLAKRFDMSIKSEYEPEGKDKALEKYVSQLDKIYQRSGKKHQIQNEKLDLSVQSKKRKRKRSSAE